MLVKDGHEIKWSHLISAYRWDVRNNTVRSYEKLTDGHFSMDTAAKLRNHLAEEVLNENMLKLVLEYVERVPDNGDSFKGVVDFLTQTSKVVGIFKDVKPIQSIDDERMDTLKQFHKWLLSWENSAENSRQLLSKECRQDWSCTILAFCSLVENVLETHPDAELVPATFNTNLLKNVFGCQRGLVAGTGENPTVLQYCENINTITLANNTLAT